MQKLWKRLKGFTVQFIGTSVTLTIPWIAAVDFPDDLLVFGPPLDGTRNYNRYFGNNQSETSRLRHILRGLARDTTGGVYASGTLITAFDELTGLLAEERLQAEINREALLSFNKTPM